MRARAHGRGGQRHQRAPRFAVRKHAAAHAHSAGGERAGLVEHHGVDRAQLFQRRGVFNENAQLRAPSRARHNGRGRGKPQCARAGNHQHAHGGLHGKRGAFAEYAPQNGRRQRKQNDQRHKYGGHAVGRARNRRLGRARFLHQRQNLIQAHVRAAPLRAHCERAVQTHACAQHRIALVQRDWRAFAREHGHIQPSVAGENFAVGGHHVAPAHENRISGGNLRRRNDRLIAAANHARRLRAQPLQPRNGLAGAHARQRFGILAQRHQRQNHGGAVKIQVHLMRHAGGQLPRAHHQLEQTVGRGRARAQRNQRVHVGREVNERFPAAGEYIPAQNNDWKQQNQLHHGGGERIAERFRQRQAQGLCKAQIQNQQRKQPHEHQMRAQPVLLPLLFAVRTLFPCARHIARRGHRGDDVARSYLILVERHAHVARDHV